MKRTLLALAVSAFAATPALAGHSFKEHCEVYAAENGTDASGCGCLQDTADADATEELLLVTGPEDIEALSDGSKEAIAACFPDA